MYDPKTRGWGEGGLSSNVNLVNELRAFMAINSLEENYSLLAMLDFILSFYAWLMTRDRFKALCKDVMQVGSETRPMSDIKNSVKHDKFHKLLGKERERDS